MGCSQMSKKKIIIKPDKPLPPRISSEYWELFAKLILEHFYPKKYFDLSVDGEKPDLQNEETKIGIEVTSVEDKRYREINSLYSRDYSHGNSDQKTKARKRIEKLGGKVEKYCLLCPVIDRNINKIYAAVKEKTQKLNKDYRIFCENDLFIFDSGIILEEELPEMAENISASGKGNEHFNKVYLYCLGNDLYEFDIINRAFRHLKDDEKMIQCLAHDARQILIDKYR